MSRVIEMLAFGAVEMAVVSKYDRIQSVKHPVSCDTSKKVRREMRRSFEVSANLYQMGVEAMMEAEACGEKVNRNWDRSVGRAIKKAEHRAKMLEKHNLPKAVRDSFADIRCWRSFMGC